jgi:hypothetical protein
MIARQSRHATGAAEPMEGTMARGPGVLGVALTLAAAIGCGAGPVLAQVAPPTPPGQIPAFKVEAVGFKALDETGYDWAGSDEIRVGFVTPFEDITSREFGDVDSGETRPFNADESCIVPVGAAAGRRLGRLVGPPSDWFCADLGRPGPLGFEVVVAEQDISLFGFDNPPTVVGPGDDLIGRKTLSFTPEGLLAAMPAVGGTVEEDVLLGPCVAPLVCPGGFFEPSPAEYRVTLRLTRMPDAPPPIDPDPSSPGARRPAPAF